MNQSSGFITYGNSNNFSDFKGAVYCLYFKCETMDLQKNCVGWHKTTPVQVFELKKQFPPSKSIHLVDNFRKHKGPFQ